MRPGAVVIGLERVELSLEIARVPKRRLIEKLSTDGAGQPLDERVR